MTKRDLKTRGWAGAEWTRSLHGLHSSKRFQRLCAWELYGLKYPTPEQMPSHDTVKAWLRGEYENDPPVSSAPTPA